MLFFYTYFFFSPLVFPLNIFAELSLGSVSRTNISISEYEEFNFNNLTNRALGETNISKDKIDGDVNDIVKLSGKEWREIE